MSLKNKLLNVKASTDTVKEKFNVDSLSELDNKMETFDISKMYKVFRTIADMNNDSDAKEGDKAVVHRIDAVDSSATTEFSTAIFPDTVILDEAISDSVSVYFRPVESSSGMFDCYGQLSSSGFTMDIYSETIYCTISYESSDGITYTRTSSDSEVDFGIKVKCGYPQGWNNALGKFIRVNGNIFEGLYEYQAEKYDTLCRSSYLGSSIPSKTAINNNVPDEYIKLPVNLTPDMSITVVVHSTTDIIINGQNFKQAVDFDVYTSSAWFIPELNKIAYEQWNVNDYNYIIDTYHNENKVSSRTVLCKESDKEWNIPAGGGGTDAVHILGEYSDTDYIMWIWRDFSLKYSDSFYMVVDSGTTLKRGTTNYLKNESYNQDVYNYKLIS